MRYILDVSGHDLKLIRASIVNFQRTLELSNHAEFDNIIDDLDECFFKISSIKFDGFSAPLTAKTFPFVVFFAQVSLEVLLFSII